MPTKVQLQERVAELEEELEEISSKICQVLNIEGDEADDDDIDE